MNASTDGARRGHSPTATPAALPPPTGLDGVLEAQQAFDMAQGALAELSGGTARRASAVLVHLAAQLGFPKSAAAGSFFLACLVAQDTDEPTRGLVRRTVAAVAPADRGTPYSRAGHRDRLTDVEPGDPISDHTDAAPVDGMPGMAFGGELDIATGPALQAAVTSRHPAGDLRLLLDLRDLTFCDVAGVRSLSTIYTHVTAYGGSLTVRPPTALSSRRMLHLAVASGWLPREFARVSAH